MKAKGIEIIGSEFEHTFDITETPSSGLWMFEKIEIKCFGGKNIIFRRGDKSEIGIRIIEEFSEYTVVLSDIDFENILNELRFRKIIGIPYLLRAFAIPGALKIELSDTKEMKMPKSKFEYINE